MQSREGPFTIVTDSQDQTAGEVDWRTVLYTPTAIAQIGDLFFIADCWHHRVVYSSSLQADIGDWLVLDAGLEGPHSIATDGRHIVVEEAGRHAVRIYEQRDRNGQVVTPIGSASVVDTFSGSGSFIHRHTIEDVGLRPHRIQYQEQTNSFYVLGSHSQDVARIAMDGNRVFLAETIACPFLEDAYTRSFTIDGDRFVFVAGPGRIQTTKLINGRFELDFVHPIPSDFVAMNDLFRSSRGWWYLTATPQHIIRARSLDDFSSGDYEDLHRLLSLQGTPCYVSEIGGRIFVPQIAEHSGIVSFVEGGPTSARIDDLRVHFDFGPPSSTSLRRKEKYRK